MEIEVRNSFSFSELLEQCWCGAVDTLKTIQEHNKEEEFMDYLNVMYGSDEQPPTMTELNDFIRFESEQIFEYLEIEE